MKLTDNILTTLVRRGYAKKVRKIVEADITEPDRAYWYAWDVIHGRFPAMEPAIGKSMWAYDYAYEIIDGPFPLGEHTIVRSDLAGHYYHLLLQGGYTEDAKRFKHLMESPEEWDR